VVDEKAKLPEGTELTAEELGKKTSDFDYDKYCDDVLSALQKDSDDVSGISFIRFYDISLMSDGEAVEPSTAVSVRIAYDKAVKTGDASDIRIVHFAENKRTGKEEAVLLDDKESNVDTTVEGNKLSEASFDADGFSVFAVVGAQKEAIETEVINAKGETYTITAEYDPEATGIPAGASLKIKEITGDDADPYAVAAANKLDVNVDDISFARFFDITIADKSGKEYHDLGDAIQLSIRYKSALELEEGQKLNVVHFKDGLEKEPEMIDSDLSNDGKEVTFEQDGFSVTATIVTDTSNLSTASDYVIYTKVLQDDGETYKYYALSRFDGNHRSGTSTSADGDSEGAYSREITVNEETKEVTYSGAPEDILWKLEKSGTYYRFKYDGGYVPSTNQSRYLMRYYGSLIISSYIENSDCWNGNSGANAQGLDWTYDTNNNSLTSRKGGALHFDSTSKMFNTGTASPIYFATKVSTVSTNWSKPTVKYVDQSGNEIYSGGRDWTTHIRNAYVIYDIEGYDYVETRITNYATGTKINPVIRYGGNGTWFYTNTKLGGDPENNDNIWLSEKWNDLGSNTVYVIYKETEEPVTGGTPVAHASDDKTPAAPTIHKGSKENGNGTNTLSLEITADTVEQKVYKLADVIVILDMSSSMNRNMDNDNTADPATNSREYLAKQTIKNVANTLIGSNTAFQYEDENGVMQKQIRMSLIKFDYKAATLQPFTDDYETFAASVDGATRHVGTNWEDALRTANYLDTIDQDRATFVIFVTDGNPSVRVTRGNLLNFTNSYGSYAKYVDDAHVDVAGERTYKYLRAAGFFGDQNELDERNYYSALDRAKSIVDHNKNLYAIGIGMTRGIDRLRKLVGYAYTGNQTEDYAHTKLAQNATELQEAFNLIVEEIAALKGYSDISMYDGLTDMSSTVMEKSSLLGVSDDFKYWKAPAPAGWDTWTDEQKAAYRPAEDAFVEWDPASEKCDPASYDAATNAVKWDMGSRFMPQAGCTYRVTFKVWPNQDAYDLISDLNNGVVNYDDLSDAIKSQINEVIDGVTGAKSYTMNTNRSDAYTTYKTAEKVGTNITTTGSPVRLDFNSVPAMPLTETEMGVIKHWNDSAYSTNRPGHLYLGVLRDGAGIYIDALPSDAIQQEDEDIYYSASHGCYYYKTTVGSATKYQYVVKLESPDWSASTFISPGLTVDGIDLEPGHDYTFHELPDDYHYELVGDPVHPMLVDSASAIYDKATGKTIVNFEVTNDLRGGIEVKKKVIDSNGNDISSQEGVKDTEFTFTVTELVSADGSDIWYSKYKADGTQIDLAPGDPDTMSAIISQGDTFTLKPGDYIRLLNVPIGTRCVIKETDPSGMGYKLYSIVQSENGTATITDIIENLGTGNKTSANVIRKTEANKNYQILFVNKPNFEVEIEKVDASDGTKKIGGVEFSLFADSDCTRYATDASGDPYGTAKVVDGETIYVLTTDANGKIQLGVLPLGTYYLKEVSAPEGYIIPESPIVITVAANGVTATQGGKPLTVTAGTNNTKYTIVATNSMGAELPHTGGIGTLPYTLGGGVLIIAAALMYGFRLRRRERRSE